MVQEAPPRRGESRLYDWLVRREEEALLAPGGVLEWTPEQPAYDGSVQRLMALREGREINIPATDLPAFARDRPLAEYQWWHRAIVSADGAVRYVDDSGEWLRENGL